MVGLPLACPRFTINDQPSSSITPLRFSADITLHMALSAIQPRVQIALCQYKLTLWVLLFSHLEIYRQNFQIRIRVKISFEIMKHGFSLAQGPSDQMRPAGAMMTTEP